MGYHQRLGLSRCSRLDLQRRAIYNDEHYFDGAKVIGVDEHRWSHNRRKWRDGYVTVIVDMTDHHDKDGNVIRPGRLLDVVPARRANALRTWLNNKSEQFRDQVKIISMDGFQGYATAAGEVIAKAPPKSWTRSTLYAWPVTSSRSVVPGSS